jgi:hypothetical protein
MVPAIRSSRFAVSLLLLALCGALLQSSVVHAQAPLPSTPPAAVTLPTDAERESFLAAAQIVRTRGVSKGVTNTLRATLSDGVTTHDASIQTIDEYRQVYQTPRGTELNFRDSWRFNVAAYRVDRLLELGMIPVAVERRHGGKPGSFSWWVDDVLMDEHERYRKKHTSPDTADWNQQMSIARLFDQLIANVDRNLGNLLIDREWRVWLIDHSRSFRLAPSLRSPKNLSRVDRALLERLRVMDKPALIRVVGDYLTPLEVDAVLARRDLIVAHFEQMGAAGVFDRKPR